MINNIHQAVKRAESELRKQVDPVYMSFYYCNNGRHCMIDVDNDKYYVMFKREFFKSFGQIFENQKGIGESINANALSNAITLGAKYILIIYPNGYIYKVDPLEWQDFAVKNNTIRQPHSEKTFSIPVSMLERFDVTETTVS